MSANHDAANLSALAKSSGAAGQEARAVTPHAELLQDGNKVLDLCDAVLGAITVALSVFATVAAVKGKAAVVTALLMWSLPVVNVALSQLSKHTKRIYLTEAVRTFVSLPIAVLLYLTRGGYFEALWLPAEIMVVAQGVFWGCFRGDALLGQVVTLAFGGSILLAGSVSAGHLDWSSVHDALGVTITGSIVSLVAGWLGRSLREARERRDEAEGHKQRLEVAFHDLANARGRLDAVLECVPGFIVAVDRSGLVEFANRKASPVGSQHLIGTNVLEHVSLESRERFDAQIQAVLETGEQQVLESRTTTNGIETWYASHLGAMWSAGQIVGTVIISQDVTQLKRSQVEVVAAQRMAAVGTLASGIAHEINTPIQFVNDSMYFLGEAARDLLVVVDKFGALQREVEAGRDRQALTAALEAASLAQREADLPYLIENVPAAFARCLEGLERVATIVRSMKEFAHPPQTEMIAADLNRAIQNTLTISGNEYKQVADVRTSFGDIPPVTCYVNEVNQVVLNLIVNAAHAIGDAVKGTTNRGVITIETRLEGEDVLISIRDTGTGIPESAQARIFEPFFTTKEVGKGTGQGLALVWSIVKEKHGGDITFDTKVGEGTRFVVRLPCAGRPHGAHQELPGVHASA